MHNILLYVLLYVFTFCVKLVKIHLQVYKPQRELNLGFFFLWFFFSPLVTCICVTERRTRVQFVVIIQPHYVCLHIVCQLHMPALEMKFAARVVEICFQDNYALFNGNNNNKKNKLTDKIHYIYWSSQNSRRIICLFTIQSLCLLGTRKSEVIINGNE